MAIDPEFGRYRILQPLAVGGSASIYLAEDREHERQVALKLWLAHPPGEPGPGSDLLRAAHALQPLSHPNLVAILDAGTRDGRIFVATEFVPGGTLAQLLERGRLDRPLAERLMADLAAALQYLHDRPIVHGGINPHALLIDADRLKVLPGLTRESLSLMETPPRNPAGAASGINYLAPEQIRGEPVGPPADAFAFGAVCYEMLSGRRAFTGTPLEVMNQILDGRIEPLAVLRPAVNPYLAPSLADLIDRFLDVEPARRPRLSAFLADATFNPSNDITFARLEIPATQTGTLSAPARPAPQPAPEPVRVDDHVQFTLYRPPAMAPERWYPMPFFAHLAEQRPDAPAGTPDPLAEVARRAQHALGSSFSTFAALRQDGRVPIPEAGVLRIVPAVPGLQFNPVEHAFLWLEPVHQLDFRVKAGAALNGRTAHGSVAVYLGVIPVADITLAIPIRPDAAALDSTVPETAQTYRRIFASYSHKDHAIVRQFEAYAKGLGDRYLRDVIDLRAGEAWDARLCGLIEEADVFQLFWSSNSMRSAFVRREWEHALTVPRKNFVRPLYWETPLPEGNGLPTPELRAKHFAFVGAREPDAAMTRVEREDDTGTRVATPAPAPSAARAPRWTPPPPTPERQARVSRPASQATRLTAAIGLVIAILTILAATRWC